MAWGVGFVEADGLNMGSGKGDGTTMAGISMTRKGFDTCGVVDRGDRKSDTVLIKCAEASLRTSANIAGCGPAIWSVGARVSPPARQSPAAILIEFAPYCAAVVGALLRFRGRVTPARRRGRWGG